MTTQLLAADVTNISVSARPASVSAAGGTAAISAKVSDGADKPAADVPVTFSADHGSLSAAVVTTDATGTARVFLTTNTTTNVTVIAGAAASARDTARGPSAKVTVTVSSLPTVSISASIQTSPKTPTGRTGTSVTLTIRAIPAAGHTIVSLLVDYGDGRVESIAPKTTSVSHEYSAAGSYRVTVTATDNLGGSGSAGIEIGPT